MDKVATVATSAASTAREKVSGALNLALNAAGLARIDSASASPPSSSSLSTGTVVAGLVGGVAAVGIGAVVASDALKNYKASSRPAASGFVAGSENIFPVSNNYHNGELVAQVLVRHGVKFIFCLAGGHIAPILSGCVSSDMPPAEGSAPGAPPQKIRIIDVRHEANAVFAADGVARTTGTVGVAAVTAGPGVANTICAIKNAQMAQSPVLILGGATSNLLKGRGSLQDIDQRAMVEPHVKHFEHVDRASDIVPAVERALQLAMSGVPGPVFLEFPLDLLYSQEAALKEIGKFRRKTTGAFSVDNLLANGLNWVFDRHIRNTFNLSHADVVGPQQVGTVSLRTLKSPQADKYAFPELWNFYNLPRASDSDVQKAASRLVSAQRPVVMIGSQAVLESARLPALAAAIELIGAPVFLSGAARGLLGRDSRIQYTFQRSNALRETDVVLVAGVVNDFRMGYGTAISQRAHYISANRSQHDLYLNRRPSHAVLAESADFVIRVAQEVVALRAAKKVAERPYAEWHAKRQSVEQTNVDGLAERRTLPAYEIRSVNAADIPEAERVRLINPIILASELEKVIPENGLIVADGGDIVGTCAYALRGRGPLTWLDPGSFGTLGVGFGFVLGAALARPEREVWCIFGDGAVGFSMIEMDTLVRHGVRAIAVVGNDGCWTQIHRDAKTILSTDCGCMLTRNPYDRTAESLGCVGISVGGSSSSDDNAQAVDGNSAEAVNEALLLARKHYVEDSKPVLVNVHIGKSDFREGSMSM